MNKVKIIHKIIKETFGEGFGTIICQINVNKIIFIRNLWKKTTKYITGMMILCYDIISYGIELIYNQEILFKFR